MNIEPTLPGEEIEREVFGEKVFRNSSLRNQFCNNVIRAFEEAQNTAELEELFAQYGPTIDSMMGGSDFDVLGAENLIIRHRAALARVKDEHYRLSITLADIHTIDMFNSMTNDEV